MSYTLAALIAHYRTLKQIADDQRSAAIVPLEQGLGLIPANAVIEKDDTTLVPDVALYSQLTYGVADVAAKASKYGLVAYVEAEFFGGVGFQTAILWEDGKIIFGPYQAGNDPDVASDVPLRDMPINAVLRRLGVVVTDDHDEFMAVGLHKRRNLSEWIARYQEESDDRE